MSIYYIEVKTEEDGLTVFTLDATENIEYTLPVQSTSYAVEDGSNISDNIALRPRTVSFSGVITDVKNRIGVTSNLSTQEYIQSLEAVRDNRELFTIYFAADLPPMEDVFFETLKFSQDSTNGSVATTTELNVYGVSSFKVSFTVKEFRLSSKAGLTVIKAKELNIDNKSSSSASTTDFSDQSKPSDTLIEEGEDTIARGKEMMSGR